MLKKFLKKLSIEIFLYIARVPELPAGQYTLRVVTRFAAGANVLKEPRIIDYDRLLVIP